MKKIILSITLLVIGLATGWFLQPLLSGQPPVSEATQAGQPPESQAGQPPNQARSQAGGRRGMMRPEGGETVANEGLTVEAVSAQQSLQQPEIAVLVTTDYQGSRDLVTKSDGDVVQVLVTLGQPVRAGDVLVQVQSDALERQRQSQVLAIEQQLASQQLAELTHQVNLAALDDAKQTLSREQSLAQRNLASDAALNNAESALRSAQLAVDRFVSEARQRQAQIEQARLALADIDEKLASLTVKAPFDGVVSQLMVDEGDRVNTNSTLASVATGTLYRGVVPQAYGEQLTLQSSSLSIGEHTAILTQRATQAEQGTLAVEFGRPQTPSQVGQQTLAYLALPAIEAVALPISALYQLDHVFEVRDGRLHQQSANVLGYQQRQDQLWALVELPDLPDGGVILTTTLSNASEGTQVKVRQ